jgi:hypothetical protein
LALLIEIVPLALYAAWAALLFAVNAKLTSDAFANWMDGLTPFARLVLIAPAKLSVALARHLTHNLGGQWRKLEGIAVTWMSGIYQWSALALTQAMEWPYYLVRFQFWLLDVYLPKIIRAIPHLASRVVHAVTTRVIRVERTVVRLPKLSKAQARALIAAAVATYVHPYLAQLRWLRAHFHALTAVLPHALPLPQFPTFPNIWKRIRRLERRLAPAAITALVVAALARMGLGWIRCNKTKRVGKAICGLDNSLIDKFLLDALAIFGVISIVEFAEGLLAIEDEAVSIMGKLVREWPT